VCPSAVKQWHLSFLNSGSDIITTNTYQIPLAECVPDIEVPAAIRSAVQLAVEASEEAGHGAVALSFGTKNSNYGKGEYSVEPLAPFDEYASYHRDKISQFHDALRGLWDKIEYLAFETVSSYEEAKAVLCVLDEKDVRPMVQGKKAWITFSCGDGSIPRLRNIISRIAKSPCISALWGIGVNCIGIDIALNLAKMVDEEVRSNLLALVVYPDAGSWKDRTTAQFIYDAPVPTDDDVDRWSQSLKELRHMDRNEILVGGCCNTDPRFIRKLYDQFKYLSKYHSSISNQGSGRNLGRISKPRKTSTFAVTTLSRCLYCGCSMRGISTLTDKSSKKPSLGL